MYYRHIKEKTAVYTAVFQLFFYITTYVQLPFRKNKLKLDYTIEMYIR